MRVGLDERPPTIGVDPAGFGPNFQAWGHTAHPISVGPALAASEQQLDVYVEGAVDLERAHQRVLVVATGYLGRLELAKQVRRGSSTEESAVREARREEACDGRRTPARGRR